MARKQAQTSDAVAGAAGEPAPAKKTAKKTAAAAKSGTAKKAASTAAQKTSVTSKKAAAEKTTTKSTAAKKAEPAKVSVPSTKKSGRDAAAGLVVKEDESPWTPAELDEVRAELSGEIDRLVAELTEMEADLAGLIRDAGDGAGDDQADVGTKNFATEHEYTVAQNARDSLAQCQRALERIDDGTYGVCESCGKPIGKLRLQAFPRATLCMPCKKESERR